MEILSGNHSFNVQIPYFVPDKHRDSSIEPRDRVFRKTTLFEERSIRWLDETPFCSTLSSSYRSDSIL